MEIFNSAIARVRNSYPSIYSKEDVIALISELALEVETHLSKSSNTITEDDIKALKQRIAFKIREMDVNELVDLRLTGYDNREIEVDLDTESIVHSLEFLIDNELNK